MYESRWNKNFNSFFKVRNVLVTVFLFFSGFGFSQIIDNSKAGAFSEDPFFNPEFIKKNRIKSIVGRTSTKKEMDIVRESDLIQYYEFDTSGKIIKQMNSRHMFGTRTDTTTIMYHYDNKGRLITKRQNDNFSFYSYNYEYDSLGNVIRESYSRDENCGPSKYKFQLGNRYIITTEGYKYLKRGEHELVKKYYNSSDREYQERIFKYNPLGYLVSESTFYSLTSRQSFYTEYSYDERGQLASKYDITDMESKSDQRLLFKYDDKGNLIEQEFLKDGKRLFHRELLYDKTTMLMNAQLTKDERTKVIFIVKYTYEFY